MKYFLIILCCLFCSQLSSQELIFSFKKYVERSIYLESLDNIGNGVYEATYYHSEPRDKKPSMKVLIKTSQIEEGYKFICNDVWEYIYHSNADVVAESEIWKNRRYVKVSSTEMPTLLRSTLLLFLTHEYTPRMHESGTHRWYELIREEVILAMKKYQIHEWDDNIPSFEKKEELKTGALKLECDLYVPVTSNMGLCYDIRPFKSMENRFGEADKRMPIRIGAEGSIITGETKMSVAPKVIRKLNWEGYDAIDYEPDFSGYVPKFESIRDLGGGHKYRYVPRLKTLIETSSEAHPNKRRKIEDVKKLLVEYEIARLAITAATHQECIGKSSAKCKEVRGPLKRQGLLNYTNSN